MRSTIKHCARLSNTLRGSDYAPTKKQRAHNFYPVFHLRIIGRRHGWLLLDVLFLDMLQLVKKPAPPAIVEVTQNKLGWWAARLTSEVAEKPLHGWTGFVYPTEADARNRIRDYAHRYGLEVMC